RLAEALAMLDPTGRKLHLVRMLTVAAEDDTDSIEDDADTGAAQAQPGISAAMVEQIGEIAASQSMVSHMLKELTETDLAEAADAILRGAGNDIKRARTDLRALLGQFTTRLQEVAQLDSQLITQLAELQEATVALRARPVESMLRPLETYFQAHAQRQGRTLHLSHSGGELSVDLTLLEQVRRMLRTLVLERLQAAGPAAPATIHMAFHRDEERMAVIVEDDGAHLGASPAIDAIEAELFTSGGDLRRVNLPGRGMRFHFTLPLAMVVLEGMVVGVDGVRYVMPVEAIRMILQPDEERRIRVSAADNHELLRIADSEYVPIRPLGAQTRDGGRNVFVVLGVERQSIAIPVDELVGQQLVLLRPLRGVLRRVQNMTGIALLAGGDVGMVVSANQLCAQRTEGQGKDAAYLM
ncbi:MAG: chemotaxis protein CheA, partial [Rhodobacteraceae bacterium]|nr:chemotaxis protein CheA [Paracoccaceae bacterium]